MPRKKKIKYKDGPREDLSNSPWFRSSWERNISRLLDYLKISWQYEPKRFYFSVSTDSYLPDFLLISENPWNCKWLEVKGLWHKGDKKKIMLFNFEYPNQTLHVLAQQEYKKLQHEYKSLIKDWER